MATDAFGRLRTSTIHTLFDYAPSALSSQAHSGLDADIWVSSTSGSGTTLAYNTANYIQMSVSANSSSVTRQTKLPMEYQPGKSRLFYLSVVPLSRSIAGGESYVARFGCYSTNGSNVPVQGHYFETDGTTLYWVECYGGTANRVPQSSWNLDAFDGNGASGKTLTISSMLVNLLVVMDQEWLGIGRVRLGFNINGVNYYAHQFTHSLTYPYTTTPRLPITYQIVATTVSSAIEIRQICCTCMSEGGVVPSGRRVALTTPIAGVNMAIAARKYIIMGIRIQSGFDASILRLLNYDFLYPGGNSNQWVSVEIQLHSTNGSIGAISTSLTYTPVSNSCIEYYTGASTGANPYITTDGYMIRVQNNISSTNTYLDETEYTSLLTRTVLSKYDTMYLCGTVNTGTNQVVLGSMEIIDII